MQSMQKLLLLPLKLRSYCTAPNTLFWCPAGHVAIMLKVMIILALELAVLPVVYGFFLDVCAVPLMGGTAGDRMAWLRMAPLSWSLLHWLLGMGYLLCAASFLSMTRRLLRPGWSAFNCA